MKESRQRLPRSGHAPEAPHEGNDREDYLRDYDQRLRFEMLLTDLSSRLCATSPENIDGEIESTLRRVCEVLGLDLSAVWQREAGNPDNMIMTHLYRAQEGPPPPERMEASEYFPWCLEQVLARRTVAMAATEDAPPEAARDVEIWRHFGVKTTLTVPLIVGDEPPFGAVSFNDVVAEREWAEPLVSRLQLVAEMLANAIVRKRQEQALCRSEARLKLAAESAGAGLWSLDTETRRFWLTDLTRKIFGYGPEDVVTFERFVESVHPSDRQIVNDTLAQVLATEAEVDVEYRIVREDGKVRWLVSRGRLQKRIAGEEATVIIGATLDITARKVAENKLRRAFEEVKALREQVQNENIYLKNQIRNAVGETVIVGESKPVKRMLMLAKNVARTDAPVLVTGETGTGKELLVRVIHDLSARSHRTMVKVNCAALPAALIESELFGRERGAYTGAMTRQLGRFEVAKGSTIFLDEIGDLPIDLQTKLLRVLEDGTFERLGNVKTLSTDARVIAATNRDVAAMVERGDFREDLYHRLNVFPIAVPPLRDRTEDIPLLTWKFVRDFNEKMGRSVESIPPSTMQRILAYPWPGNVRELRNVIERAMILSTDRVLHLELPGGGVGSKPLPCTLAEVERDHIRAVLERVQWRISGKGGAAETLGLVPTTLHSKMKKLGITRPQS